EAATPDDLIKLVLTAPVDLLWNGGIGTYVKARQQRHEDIGDKANDRVRVDGEELRCKVVTEGGNLGFSQAGRIRYARRGGLINADWIDNSAGVDCSDHEVNIKILLQRACARGALDETGRLRLLRAMQGAVGRHVLRNNYHQARAISHAQLQSEKYLDWYRHAISRLQETLRFDRAREQLPLDAVLPRRAARGVGLYRPELATLLAQAKIAHCRELVATGIPDDPYLEPLLFSYFPAPIREQFADDVRAHPLRREIVTTLLVNELINRMGITFCHRLAVETGAGTEAIIRAYLVARGCIDLARVWQAIDALDLCVPFAAQSELVLTVRRVAERATRWLLAQDPGGDAIAATVARFQPHCAQLRARFPLAARAREVAQQDTVRRVVSGIPATLARDVARLDHLDRAFEIGQLAQRSGKSFAEVASCAAASDDTLRVSLLRDVARALPSTDVWQDRARNELIININAFHVGITAAALAVGGLRAWQARHGEVVGRMRAITADLDPTRETQLAQLLVLVSQLRSLAASISPTIANG
ncbi:MAG: NAD-glutamate dehydrogenase, partial [Gammaproteobacteria bacterium]|nr:NAD-glutamate dehydrogenase [Gammaproteobacteria bacterium]